LKCIHVVLVTHSTGCLTCIHIYFEFPSPIKQKSSLLVILGYIHSTNNDNIISGPANGY